MTDKERYLSEYAKWREMHSGCASESELSEGWDRMKPKERAFALRNIIDHNIIARAAQRAGEQRRS